MEKRNLLENVPFILLSALIFLLPIFFIPSAVVPFAHAKTILLATAVLLCLFTWVILSVKKGEIVLPINWLSLFAILIPIVFFISALASPNQVSSLISSGADMGTASFILLLTLSMFLIAHFAKTEEKIFRLYVFFGASFLLLAVFEILRLFFGPNFLSFHYFTDITTNPLGKWNDLAILGGLATLLSLITLELVSVKRYLKILLYIILVLGLFLLAIANFTILWATPISIITLIGLFALTFFVYFISSKNKENHSREIPIPSLIVLILAIVFTLAAGPLGGKLVSFFHINNLEVSPTWRSTLEVEKSSLSHNAFLGSGPNRFEKEWNLSKPDGVNQTDYWNSDFNYGVGTIPTFFITTGILGMIAWILFFVFFVFYGARAIFYKEDNLSRYLAVSSFFAALFLWIVNILYVPGLVVFALAFIFTGIFIGSLYQMGILREKNFIYHGQSSKAKSFSVILVLVLVIIAIITWGYFLAEKVTAAIYFNQSIEALSKNDAQTAENKIISALNVDRNPVFYRFLAQVELAKLSILAQSGSADNIKTELPNILNNAVTAANAAVAGDPTDYQNWLSLGGVYENVIPLGISGSADIALKNYQEALKHNPSNPGIYLLIARVEAVNKNTPGAKENILSALKLKNNYLDAVYLLSQVDLAAGNSNEAINDLAAAATVAPNNPAVYFQIGVLNYNLGQFEAAAAAFNQAVTLVPNYADAKYYLGISYYKLGRKDEATKQFQDLASTNPNNSIISAILANLKAGRDPISQVNASSTNVSVPKPL